MACLHHQISLRKVLEDFRQVLPPSSATAILSASPLESWKRMCVPIARFRRVFCRTAAKSSRTNYTESVTEYEEHLFRQALEYHQRGQLAEASQRYEEILQTAHDEVDVLYLLAVLKQQSSQSAQAVDLIRRALTVAPDQDRCYHLLGMSLASMGMAEEAEGSFRRAIALSDSADSYNNLGALWKGLGRLDDAIAAYREALARDLESVDAQYNLGIAYRFKGLMEPAADCFKRTIVIEPEHADAQAALGQTLLALDRAAEAVPLLQKVVALKPNDAELVCDLGNGLQTLGHLRHASAAYRRALEIDPKLSRAWYAAGCAESSQKQFVSAIACFRRALDIQPDWSAARHNLAKALYKLGQVEEALELFRLAAEGPDPELPSTAIAVIIPGDPASDNQAILNARRTWAEGQFSPQGAPERPSCQRQTSNRPLRVGYISAFFQDYNWMKPVWGLINHHDRRSFQVHLFSDAPASKIKVGYRPHPEDRFYDTSGLSTEQLFHTIEEAGIDLVVDLNGYSAVERLPLFIMRPAPTVVAWFNMYATSGMATYDYLIGDDSVVFPDEEKFYCEKIARVPGSYLTFEVSYPVPPVSGLPCQASGTICFGCLASQYKITNGVVAVWSEILRREPNSSLVVKNAALASTDTQRFLLDLFERNHISSDRIQLFGPSDHYQFLEAYSKIDIALDTFPYNGGTTTTEAIWQGVPVVTFVGDRWVSRTSASILHAANLDELIGQGIEEYISKAVHLASSWEYLSDIRRTMRSRLGASPVCDTLGFAKNMEKLYSSMCRGQ
jgi:protein O-GlcNAc transferase